MPRMLRILYDRPDQKSGAATITVDGNVVCRLNSHETFGMEISGAEHSVHARIGLLPVFSGHIPEGAGSWTLAYQLKGLNINGGGRFLLYEDQPGKSPEEIRRLIRTHREEIMKTLTSEEALVNAVRTEGLDQYVDFAISNPYGIPGSVRLNRLADGSYELYQIGDRGIEGREVFTDPPEAFYNALLLLRMLGDAARKRGCPAAPGAWSSGQMFSAAEAEKPIRQEAPDQKADSRAHDPGSAGRKGFVLWGRMISVELDQVRDSSLQELIALGRGVGDTNLVARYRDRLYILQPVRGKIDLWRNGVRMHTVSPEETDEIYAVQFDVRYQGEWFHCPGVGAIEYADGSHDCLIDDPADKLPSHSQRDHYMWGSCVEINTHQIEAVRLWRSQPLTGLPAQNGAEI